MGGAVEFVDKHDDRGFAHAAHLHQFPCLAFHSFCRVNDNDDAVASGQCPERIFCKILVPWGVEDVDFNTVIFESHDGGCNGNTSLTFNFHEV